VYDLTSLECTLRFPVEHSVDRCAITWLGGDLAVLINTGCASIYAVDPSP
jgi:hypothetical protein